MPSSIKEIMEAVTDRENEKRIAHDYTRYLLYNGKLKDVVANAISKEFLLRETVQEMINRIIPINITQKIINKLAGVYLQAPIRMPADRNPGDAELISMYEDTFKINQKMKIANRYFKLHKHCSIEPFIDRDGKPQMRVLPSHTYSLFSDDPKQPNRPTAFVKHLKTGTMSKKEMRFGVWTDEEYYIVNGEADVLTQEMAELGFEDGMNPYGVIPVTYIPEADDGMLYPISDDDLVSMQIAICLILTDLAFATKYQAWSVLALIGAEAENFSFNPNSVISLPEGAKLEAIKPDADLQEVWSYVEGLIGLLLTTKNLSVGDISGTIQAEGASGVSKLIDRSESTEDRTDQEAYFSYSEQEFWSKYAHNILPVWMQGNELSQDYRGAFSEGFELDIHFADPAPVVSDKEKIEKQRMMLDLGLTTREMAVREIMGVDDEQARDMLARIDQERVADLRVLERNGDQGE
jgi:hypothetical protein